jgi:hypothetical protein
MLAGTVLDRVSSINDLGVIMDEKLNFSEHVDVMVRLLRCWDLSEDSHSSSEISEHTLRSLYTLLVCPKLEYASCVWSSFYDMRVDMVKRLQRRFIRYALRGLI